MPPLSAPHRIAMAFVPRAITAPRAPVPPRKTLAPLALMGARVPQRQLAAGSVGLATMAPPPRKLQTLAPACALRATMGPPRAKLRAPALASALAAPGARRGPRPQRAWASVMRAPTAWPRACAPQPRAMGFAARATPAPLAPALQLQMHAPRAPMGPPRASPLLPALVHAQRATTAPLPPHLQRKSSAPRAATAQPVLALLQPAAAPPCAPLALPQTWPPAARVRLRAAAPLQTLSYRHALALALPPPLQAER